MQQFTHTIVNAFRHPRVWATLLALAIVAGPLLPAAPAEAHCDAVNGPVVTAARQALDTGDVRLILPYVKPEAEAELTAAFRHTAEVRRLGGEAKTLADRYFFETGVRLHRTGEGAAFTGLKEEGQLDPALSAADRALETGSLDAVYAVLHEAIQGGVAERYRLVQAARDEAAHLGTVEAARERVEAELGFAKYVEELYQAAHAGNAHGPATPPIAGHTH